MATDDEIDNGDFDKTKEKAKQLDRKVNDLRVEILQTKDKAKAASVKLDWCEKDVYSQSRELVMEAEEFMVREGLIPAVKSSFENKRKDRNPNEHPNSKGIKTQRVSQGKGPTKSNAA